MSLATRADLVEARRLSQEVAAAKPTGPCRLCRAADLGRDRHDSHRDGCSRACSRTIRTARARSSGEDLLLVRFVPLLKSWSLRSTRGAHFGGAWSWFWLPGDAFKLPSPRACGRLQQPQARSGTSEENHGHVSGAASVARLGRSPHLTAFLDELLGTKGGNRCRSMSRTPVGEAAGR
jgi:hypothetical protein